MFVNTNLYFDHNNLYKKAKNMSKKHNYMDNGIQT